MAIIRFTAKDSQNIDFNYSLISVAEIDQVTDFWHPLCRHKISFGIIKP